MPAETSRGEYPHLVVSNRPVIPAIPELWLASTVAALPYRCAQSAPFRVQAAKDTPNRSSDDHAFPATAASTMPPARVGQVAIPAQLSGRR